MPLSNDERGWVMTGLSGLACILGAAFICVDIIVRQFPGKRNFKIQDSDAFLSVSLSLSFGVMLFSALYSILPSAKRSLQNGGYSAKEASWILIACFIGGVIGIQILSHVMHHFIPSHIIDCEHSHEDDETHKSNDTNDHGHSHGHGKPRSKRKSYNRKSSLSGRVSQTKSRPSSQHSATYFDAEPRESFAPTVEYEAHSETQHSNQEASSQRPPLHVRITTGISQLAGGHKSYCDVNGPCRGFSELCGQDCFKIVSARGGLKMGGVPGPNRPAGTRTVTATESTPLLRRVSEEDLPRPNTSAAPEGGAISSLNEDDEHADHGISEDSSATVEPNGDTQSHLHKSHSRDSHHHAEQADHHHHHVPANAFLSIGLQTSIAIAIHKLPEGFITFATNHANPKLGFSVFLALFIHNITEGFAMALPLYLAINNRMKAMAVSFVLGGLSQPLGAGVAALWFKVAGKSNMAPSEALYGGMFAVTAGILASVALQLFSESLDLTHSKQLCMIGAFSGMAILGMSSALTA